MDRVFLTRKEAASILQITPETVSEWVKAKKLPATRIGKRVLVPVEAINRIRAKALAGGAA